MNWKVGLVLLLVMVTAIAWFAGCDDDEASSSDYGASSDDDNDDGSEVWLPAPGVTWQWQLIDAIDFSFDVEMYDIDLFDVAAEDIAALQADGRTVICYFSAGSWEQWREDAADFPAAALGDLLENWEDERWLDITSDVVRAVMEERLDLAAQKGCDGVEPDNVDGYANDNGFGLTADDQLNFNRWLAEQAHARGLSVGLKNDLDQLEDLVAWFDWALNEECHTYDECGRLAVFTAAGKAVFNAEYVEDWADAQARHDDVCDTYPELSTIIKEWDLTPRRLACE